MKTTFLEHLRKAHTAEEQVVQQINHVLQLFLARTDLPQQRIDEIKEILKTLTQDSLRHEQTLRHIIEELERYDNR